MKNVFCSIIMLLATLAMMPVARAQSTTVTMPYAESFESYSSVADAGWTEVNPGSYHWVLATGTGRTIGTVRSAHSGNKNLCFRSNTSTRTTAFVYSPAISVPADLTASDSIVVSFWYSNQQWSNDRDSLVVEYFGSEYSGANVGRSDLMHIYAPRAEWTYVQKSVCAQRFSGGTFQIWFTGYSCYGYGITIDDVSITLERQCNVSCHAFAESYGTVSGGGYYSTGDQVTLTAIPNSGYHFAYWSDDQTLPATRTIIVPSGESSINYDAVFSPNDNISVHRTVMVPYCDTCSSEPTYTVNILSSDDQIGATAGSGTYRFDQQVEIMAIPYGDNVFLHWSDGNGVNPRTITVQRPTRLMAYFCTQRELDFLFSVAPNRQVRFSKGNLQWSSTAPGNWRFAEHQYDVIGADNANIASDYTGWIDLFGWGTSGHHDKYPYMTSTNGADYGNGARDIAGSNYDWGVYMSGGYYGSYQWRTLTGGENGEWNYLINTRAASTVNGTANARYALIRVYDGSNYIPGMLLFPDTFTWPSAAGSAPTAINTSAGSSWDNAPSYNLTQFTALENEGCVFLPAAGRRSGTNVENVGVYGAYWSSSYEDVNTAYYPFFRYNDVGTSYSAGRGNGFSVRLVLEYH